MWALCQVRYFRAWQREGPPEKASNSRLSFQVPCPSACTGLSGIRTVTVQTQHTGVHQESLCSRQLDALDAPGQPEGVSQAREEEGRLQGLPRFARKLFT